jgi:plastocyanin
VVQAGEIHALVRDKAGNAVMDAVVVVLPANKAAKSMSSATSTVIVDQIKKEFVPYVLPVQIGTAINFPNKDNISHHVYSFSPAKTFELPLYTGIPAAPVVFDKAGPVILGCNIHDWMVSYIYVSESPYFAKTGADGKAALTDLPPGNYAIRVWHPRLEGKEEATEQKMTIPPTGTVKTVWDIGLMREFRIRRAPIPGQGGYR